MLAARSRFISLNHAHQIWLSVPWARVYPHQKFPAICILRWLKFPLLHRWRGKTSEGCYASENSTRTYTRINNIYTYILTMISWMGCVASSIRFWLIKRLLMLPPLQFQGKKWVYELCTDWASSLYFCPISSKRYIFELSSFAMHSFFFLAIEFQAKLRTINFYGYELRVMSDLIWWDHKCSMNIRL